ncbi:hypothetical protein [Streptosporangium roseum]|uniref:hypothetical protein n=1 Tax=Streptosporangium roseum TaxID=2001 RepID=UPI0004CCC6D0|nr:hypothetical protein [Streptosporangium roseum]
MAKQYQVVGACVTDIPTGGPMGPTRITLYKDALLPSDVPAERIEHLLSVKLIKAVGGSEAAAQPAPSGEQGGDTKTVNARSSKADLVDHGVTMGGNRGELDALTLKELQGRYLKGPQQ